MDEPDDIDRPFENDGELEQDITESIPRVELKGMEEVSIKFGGVEINLGSSRVPVPELCNLALGLYVELKKTNGTTSGGVSYT